MAQVTVVVPPRPIALVDLSNIDATPQEGATFLDGIEANAANIRFDPTGTSAQQLSVQKRLRGVISVLDFGAACDGTTDDTTAVQAAINRAYALGGGTVILPSGRIRLTATLSQKKGVILQGSGSGWATAASGPSMGTVLVVDHNSHGVSSLAPINSFTPMHNGVRDLTLECVAPNSSTGAAYWDRGGSYLFFSNVFVFGFRYGFILDQSEQATVLACRFLQQKADCIWMTNGPDQSVGANPGYTNRITVQDCEFNQPVGFSIKHDGGYGHAYINNNYNGGGSGHIRLSGYTTVEIIGGDFEGAAGPNITTSKFTFAGANVGRPESVTLVGGLYTPAAGFPVVKIDGDCANLTMTGVRAEGSHTYLVTGCTGCETITSGGTRQTGFGSLFQGRAYVRHVALEFKKGVATGDFNYPSGIANLTRQFVQITLTGAALGDSVDLGFSASTAGFLASAEVVATDTVEVNVYNISGVSKNLVATATVSVFGT